jgi:ribose-phosphate pyrophosphokinase
VDRHTMPSKVEERMTIREENMNHKVFFTPERHAREQIKRMESPRGRLLIASCRSGTDLACKVIERYRQLLSEYGTEDGLLSLKDIDYQFANGETCVRLDRHVGGYDVFVFQSLADPTSQQSVDHNYMAFLIAARTFREHGANHVTAVLPYLAYGRQDKPTEFMREPTTARLMADLAIAAGIDRLITWHPHCGQLRGFYGNMPANMLSSLPLFVETFDRFRDRRDVIGVAPDAGASKLVMTFCRALGLNGAIASKYRPQADRAVITQIVGDLTEKKTAIVLDDELSTGGTIYALVKMLVEEKGIEQVYFAVSHNRCVPVARERLLELHTDYGLREVIVTNSIPQTKEFESLPFLSIKSLSDTLSRTINRIHYSQSVSEVFYHP